MRGRQTGRFLKIWRVAAHLGACQDSCQDFAWQDFMVICRTLTAKSLAKLFEKKLSIASRLISVLYSSREIKEDTDMRFIETFLLEICGKILAKLRDYTKKGLNAENSIKNRPQT